MTKISSEDRILQRAVEQIVVDKMSEAISQILQKMSEGVNEAAETSRPEFAAYSGAVPCQTEPICRSAQDLAPGCRGGQNSPSGADF